MLVVQRMLASRFAPRALLGTERRLGELAVDLAPRGVPQEADPDRQRTARAREPRLAGLVEAHPCDHDQLGRPLTAFISVTPIDPSQPDDYPDRLVDISEIESCWSVAGDESYILKIRVATPRDLEDLLARIRGAANVSTRTTIVLSTPYENRPVH